MRDEPTRRTRCRACGDGIERLEESHPKDVEAKVREGYCLDCAIELTTGSVGLAASTWNGTGGGRRVVRSADSLS